MSSSARKKSTSTTLQTLLESSTPSDIRTCLLDSLEKSTPSERKVLLALLAPLVVQAALPKHCVRCHRTYREKTNHPKACKIKHDQNGDGTETPGGVFMTLYCCGVQFYSEDPPKDYCILEPHTINPKDVIYYDFDEFDEFGEEASRNEYVVTCETQGCPKERLGKAAPDGNPTQDTVSKKRRSDKNLLSNRKNQSHAALVVQPRNNTSNQVFRAPNPKNLRLLSLASIVALTSRSISSSVPRCPSEYHTTVIIPSTAENTQLTATERHW